MIIKLLPDIEFSRCLAKIHVRSLSYITDEQVVKRANAAVELEIEKLKVLDAPIIVYDRKKQVIVRRNSDGTEVEVGRRLRKGHISERDEKEI